MLENVREVAYQGQLLCKVPTGAQKEALILFHRGQKQM